MISLRNIFLLREEKSQTKYVEELQKDHLENKTVWWRTEENYKESQKRILEKLKKDQEGCLKELLDKLQIGLQK